MRILNERNEEIEDYSTYCPQCGTTNIEKGALSGRDFDERGWYQTVRFTCKNIKCNNKWHNRIIILGGGTKRQNW
jgi:transposase-like protein